MGRHDFDRCLLDKEGGLTSGGTNFLMSSVLILRKQKKDLEIEVSKLRERVQTLECQNAAFLDVSADRLILLPPSGEW